MQPWVCSGGVGPGTWVYMSDSIEHDTSSSPRSGRRRCEPPTKQEKTLHIHSLILQVIRQKDARKAPFL